MDGAETNEEGEKAAEAEGREEGSGAAEGGDMRAVSNGGFRRDGSLRMLRRVVSRANGKLIVGLPVIVLYVFFLGLRLYHLIAGL